MRVVAAFFAIIAVCACTGASARGLKPPHRVLLRGLELRSGEFVAGDFYQPSRARSSAPSANPGDPAFELKIYWIGRARDPQTPVITAENLSDPASTLQRGSTSSATNAGGTFTASSVPLPSRGRWRITAASTDQWGCFDIAL